MPVKDVTHPTSFFCILVIYSSLLRQPFVGTLFYTLFWWHLNVFISLFYQLSFVFPCRISLCNTAHITATGTSWCLHSLRTALSCIPTETAYKPEGLNPLNSELNPICYLLALLGAHHFLHVSRIRVKLLTFRLLMSYIYIWSTHS